MTTWAHLAQQTGRFCPNMLTRDSNQDVSGDNKSQLYKKKKKKKRRTTTITTTPIHLNQQEQAKAENQNTHTHTRTYAHSHSTQSGRERGSGEKQRNRHEWVHFILRGHNEGHNENLMSSSEQKQTKTKTNFEIIDYFREFTPTIVALLCARGLLLLLFWLFKSIR